MTAFNNQKYVDLQKAEIMKRIEKHSKIFIECGGKLMYDHHAARVLPGYDKNIKMKLFADMHDILSVIVCIYSEDIINNKIKNSTKKSYVDDVLEMIEMFKNIQVEVAGVVITRCKEITDSVKENNKLGDSCKIENRAIDDFIDKVGAKVYKSGKIDNYPHDIAHIVSEDGFGAQPWVKTSRKVVLVTGPGAGSGKLSVCLNQMYHEMKNGIKPYYTKIETFPVWNLSIDHPLNRAYEAATMDLNDKNMIDPFHKAEYGEERVNYNRDIDAFPILKETIERITGEECPYKSPTDMGVNVVYQGIENMEEVKRASEIEISRRKMNQ